MGVSTGGNWGRGAQTLGHMRGFDLLTAIKRPVAVDPVPSVARRDRHSRTFGSFAPWECQCQHVTLASLRQAPGHCIHLIPHGVVGVQKLPVLLICPCSRLELRVKVVLPPPSTLHERVAPFSKASAIWAS